ncbi:MAG: nucleotidyltransferase domain-containing protein [Anaerolineaceae bacterium]|nr:nucleotidyltransferase domain-containing protein [Anaerolineaceae bacterium]
MLQPQDSLIVNLLKQRIQSIAPVERMIVFGSRARRDAVKESDLDVFIELQTINPHLRSQILEIAWEIGFDNDIVISIFLTSTSLLIDSPLAGNPILRTIQLEGVTV